MAAPEGETNQDNNRYISTADVERIVQIAQGISAAADRLSRSVSTHSALRATTTRVTQLNAASTAAARVAVTASRIATIASQILATASSLAVSRAAAGSPHINQTSGASAQTPQTSPNTAISSDATVSPETDNADAIVAWGSFSDGATTSAANGTYNRLSTYPDFERRLHSSPTPDSEDVEINDNPGPSQGHSVATMSRILQRRPSESEPSVIVIETRYCAICMSEFGPPFVVYGRCLHIFCHTCVVRLLSTNTNRPCPCPLCRGDEFLNGPVGFRRSPPEGFDSATSELAVYPLVQPPPQPEPVIIYQYVDVAPGDPRGYAIAHFEYLVPFALENFDTPITIQLLQQTWGPADDRLAAHFHSGCAYLCIVSRNYGLTINELITRYTRTV